ncbi:related to protein-tyrosine phosphatase [Rhynchosporium graminicola]|uniref:Related to protein-tyrosine phosphatase n=1 Tax=Rhynchosporium graminicola TaxID=2792576 RepID=A0A1E1L8S9_9HELO|nr:related to protein-tyrosine phosphatase [Rhynchosporium commune]
MTFNPGLQPPFVDIPGLANFRDIGGWPIQDEKGIINGTVKKGIFYRGPDTTTVTDEGMSMLRRELGIMVHFDLRSKGQIEKAGGFKQLDGIKRVCCPVVPDGEYSPEKAAKRYVLYASDGTESIVEAFTEILTHGAPACRTMLLNIASQSPTSPMAYYIHCTTGNNRSGVFVGILLSLLGLEPQIIAEEYALSDIGLHPIREAVVDRVMKSLVFAKSGGGGRVRAERMVGARPESMIAMLEMVERKWAGAEGYVRTICGLTEAEIEKVRKVLVRPVVIERRKPRATSFFDNSRNVFDS